MKETKVFGLTKITKNFIKSQLDKFDSSARVKTKELNDKEKTVLGLFQYLMGLDKRDEQGYFYISKSKIEQLTNLSQSTIKRITSSLVEKGFISKKVIQNRVAWYKVLIPMKQELVQSNGNTARVNTLERNIKKENASKSDTNELYSLQKHEKSLEREIDNLKLSLKDKESRLNFFREKTSDINWLKERIKTLDPTLVMKSISDDTKVDALQEPIEEEKRRNETVQPKVKTEERNPKTKECLIDPRYDEKRASVIGVKERLIPRDAIETQETALPDLQTVSMDSYPTKGKITPYTQNMAVQTKEEFIKGLRACKTKQELNSYFCKSKRFKDIQEFKDIYYEQLKELNKEFILG